MEKIDVNTMKQMLIRASEMIIEKEPYLTEIDTVIGDGDHGKGMKRGFTALKNLLKGTEYSELDTLCREAGLELLKSMGGASGVIFGTMFLGGVNVLPHEYQADTAHIVSYFEEGEKAVERRGRTKPGQKTMLDAFYPAVVAMKTAADRGEILEAVFEEGARGAAEGAEASSRLKSEVGRSKNFHEASVGLPDPGAVSTSLIFAAFADELRKEKD